MNAPYETGLLELDVPSFNAVRVLVVCSLLWVAAWCMVVWFKRRREG